MYLVWILRYVSGINMLTDLPSTSVREKPHSSSAARLNCKILPVLLATTDACVKRSVFTAMVCTSENVCSHDAE